MQTYSFSNVALNLNLGFEEEDFGGNLHVQNFAAGSNGLITIAQKAPIATTTFGAWGGMTANMQRNKSADLQFTLLQNAEENYWLEKWTNKFQSMATSLTSTPAVSSIWGSMIDYMGGDNVSFNGGIILSRPMQSRGQEIASVTWTITFESAEFTERSSKASISF